MGSVEPIAPPPQPLPLPRWPAGGRSCAATPSGVRRRPSCCRCLRSRCWLSCCCSSSRVAPLGRQNRGPAGRPRRTAPAAAAAALVAGRLNSLRAWRRRFLRCRRRRTRVAAPEAAAAGTTVAAMGLSMTARPPAEPAGSMQPLPPWAKRQQLQRPQRQQRRQQQQQSTTLGPRQPTLAPCLAQPACLRQQRGCLQRPLQRPRQTAQPAWRHSLQ